MQVCQTQKCKRSKKARHKARHGSGEERKEGGGRDRVGEKGKAGRAGVQVVKVGVCMQQKRVRRIFATVMAWQEEGEAGR